MNLARPWPCTDNKHPIRKETNRDELSDMGGRAKEREVGGCMYVQLRSVPGGSARARR